MVARLQLGIEWRKQKRGSPLCFHLTHHVCSCMLMHIKTQRAVFKITPSYSCYVAL
jgi:hypothetical protein